MSYSDYTDYNMDPLGRVRFYGTYRATVKNNVDYENKKRLSLIVPQVSGSDTIDLVDPAVSSGSISSITVPEIGETVWVVFESGDPSYPLWMSGAGSGASQGSYGSFYSNSTQASSTSAQAVTLTDKTEAIGVSLSNYSKLNFSVAGTYNIQFSAQLYQPSNGSPTITFWIKKNGTNVPETTWQYDLSNQNHYAVPSFNYTATFVANDYIEFYWSSTQSVNLQYYPAHTTSPVYPVTPSVVVNIQQVMSTEAGPTGPQGPRGYTGNNGVDGLDGTNGTNGLTGVYIGPHVSSSTPDHGQLWADTAETSSGKSYALQRKTSDYTILVKDEFITCDATASAFTITLPNVGDASNRRYFVKKIDNTVNQVLVTGTIEGDSNVRLGPGRDDMTIISDGLNFYYEGF